MRTNQKSIFRWAWTAWALLFVLYAQADVQTWTSASGNQIEAAFVRMEGDLVVLAPEEGPELSIRISLLKPEDQVRAREMAAGASAVSSKEVKRLPVLTSVPGRGYHAYYSQPNFDAFLNHQGNMTIRFKADGKRVGQDISFALIELLDRKKRAKGPRRMRPYAFREFGKASANPKTVSFLVDVQDEENFTYRVEYNFNGPEICVITEILEPKSPKMNAALRLRTHFGASYNIPGNMPLDEQQEVMKDGVVAYRKGSGKFTEQNFYSGTTLGSTEIDELRVSGPWGERVVSFTADNRSSGVRTVVWNYPKRPLHQGFTIHRAFEPGAKPLLYCIRVD